MCVCVCPPPERHMMLSHTSHRSVPTKPLRRSTTSHSNILRRHVTPSNQSSPERASENDVIEPADAAQPLAQRLADAAIGHVAGELTEAGVERRLQRQEGGVGQEEDLIEERQDHVGPGLERDSVASVSENLPLTSDLHKTPDQVPESEPPSPSARCCGS